MWFLRFCCAIQNKYMKKDSVNKYLWCLWSSHYSYIPSSQLSASLRCRFNSNLTSFQLKYDVVSNKVWRHFNSIRRRINSNLSLFQLNLRVSTKNDVFSTQIWDLFDSKYDDVSTQIWCPDDITSFCFWVLLYFFYILLELS